MMDPYSHSSGKGQSGNVMSVSCNASRIDMTEEERRCLEERKYWCFLLSSIVTFCFSMLIVVSWRVFTHLCKNDRSVQFEDVAPEETNAKFNGTASLANGDGKQMVEPPVEGKPVEEAHISWVTEAKDWAGELISGQSTTGRILVNTLFPFKWRNEMRFFFCSITLALSAFKFQNVINITYIVRCRYEHILRYVMILNVSHKTLSWAHFAFLKLIEFETIYRS